ncbi:MAG: hypothetical protein M3R36_16150 [Bacteroidota bacterium]|nr:hypothetical protein [Bacteroidota bacterium]
METTLKEEIIKSISTLPDDSDIDDIMYRLYVISKIKKGQEALIQGKYKTLEELKEEVKKW